MNPLARVKVRRSKRRGRSLTAPEVASLLEAADKPFREFLTLALETGARPDELYRLEARHVVGGRIIFEAHEAKGGIERRIVLTKAAAELVGRLVAARPIGALLRNERGEPWNRMAIHSRMWRLQQAGKLPAGISPYSLRHSFATLAIMRGVGLEELRVLMGHKTLDMIAWHYSHIDQQDQHLRDAAERATATVTATTKSVRGDVPT